MSDDAITPRIGDCWNRIGVRGDQSCPELAKVTHCRNCFVFASAGRVLLERPPTDSYRRAASREYAEEKKYDDSRDISIIVFRLGREWFALPTRAFTEISELPPIRKIPHRPGPVLLGVTSIRGEILLCVSLTALLEVEDNRDSAVTGQDARLLILDDSGELWASPADEVEGLHHAPASRVREAPAIVSRSTRAYTRGIIELDKNQIALIDEVRLFEALKGCLR